MTRAYDLYKKYTVDQLVQMGQKLRDDPDNKIGARSPWIYNRKTMRKMDEISWAITYHIKDHKENTPT